MGKVDQLFKEIEKLSLDEQQEIFQRLVDKLILEGEKIVGVSSGVIIWELQKRQNQWIRNSRKGGQ